MNIGIVGSGVTGLAAASRLHKAGYNVTVFEKDHWIGGHARTINVGNTPVDTGFMVFNGVTYPNMISWFKEHDVQVEPSDMSFGVSADNGYFEWASHGINSLFAQKTNYLNPYFYAMLYDMTRFETEVLQFLSIVNGKKPSPDSRKLTNEDITLPGDETESDENDAPQTLEPSESKDITLGAWLKKNNYSSYFINYYLIPVCAAVWSCPSNTALNFQALFLFNFFKNHHLLQLVGRPQWMTVAGRSQSYVKKVTAGFAKNIHLNTPVTRIERANGKVQLWTKTKQYEFDQVLIATQNPAQFAESVSSSSSRASTCFSPLEKEILNLFQFQSNKVVLHHDESLMPKNKSVWSSWNFLGNSSEGVVVTYWLNLLQNLGKTEKPILVTLNPASKMPDPSLVVDTWVTTHPIPSTEGTARIQEIQGTGNLWYAGAYLGNGFHEDGVKSGFIAADNIMRRSGYGTSLGVLEYPPHMRLTAFQSRMRGIITSYLNSFIKVGRLQIVEKGGNAFVFGQKNLVSDNNESQPNIQICVLSPEFYTRLALRFDLGLAEAYMDNLFETPSLLKLFNILIANRDNAPTTPNKAIGLSTALIGTLGSYFQHFYFKRNFVGQAQKNISDHYDLGNSFFSLFLDSTMQYSCGIFNSPSDSLYQSQLNKMRQLIKKARITNSTSVLEIGFGWGGLSIMIAREIGCKVTGITLSKEQKKYAEDLIKRDFPELQHLITFHLVDYRSFVVEKPFDRILSCEMLEAVGHEFLPDFFRHTDRLLAKNGIMAVQVITTPDSRYEYYRKSTDFIQQYIFPGGLCPALSALTDAMKKASEFQIESVENIGPHYARTLELWRENFLKNRDKILAMGFDEKFIRKWNYYFEYCEAGFATRTLSDLHIVFSRISNSALN